ncbi:dual specificity protein phosphatase family protein [bacterium]|nr:dual specificity protein phosphatase family protein [bacterium]
MDKMTLLPYGLPGTIYRSSMPFSRHFDPAQNLLSRYQEVGVQTVVVLSPWEETRYLTGRDLKAEYERLGLEIIYLPMQDYGVPEAAALRNALRQVLDEAQRGRVIAMHCHAGIGRTGLFAACLAKVVFGLDGDEAIDWVRDAVPPAVESFEQERFIKHFEFDPD